MNQILHIFRKDTRRFWPEILFSALASAAVAYAAPDSWRYSPQYIQQSVMKMLGIQKTISVLLLPLAWWFLSARAVQSESLVGDIHFWLTKPYEWKRLFSEKLLFLVSWMGTVYVLCQLALLHAAGFQSLTYLPGVIGTAIVYLVLLIGPVMAIASVTSTFARFTLTLLGTFVVGVAYAAVSTSYSRNVSTPYNDHIALPLLLIGCLIAMGIQYATRRAWVARGVLIATAVLLSILPFVYQSQWLVNRAYPKSDAASPAFTVTLIPNDSHPIQARSWEGQDYLDLPAAYSGVQDGYAVFVEDFKYTLTAADGSSITSPWQAMSGRIRPDGYDTMISLDVDPAVYERFKSGTVALQITYAFSRYHAASVTNWTYPERSSWMPGVGYCGRLEPNNLVLKCRSAVKDPPVVYATAVRSPWPCRSDAAREKSTNIAGGWLGNGGMLPWTVIRTSLWAPSFYGDAKRNLGICDGSPMVLTKYDLVDRTRETVTLENLRLPAEVRKTD